MALNLLATAHHRPPPRPDDVFGRLSSAADKKLRQGLSRNMNQSAVAEFVAADKSPSAVVARSTEACRLVEDKPAGTSLDNTFAVASFAVASFGLTLDCLHGALLSSPQSAH